MEGRQEGLWRANHLKTPYIRADSESTFFRRTHECETAVRPDARPRALLRVLPRDGNPRANDSSRRFRVESLIERLRTGGWNTLLASANLQYTSAGPGGVEIAGTPDELTDFRGVRGNPRQFARGSESSSPVQHVARHDTLHGESEFLRQRRAGRRFLAGNWYTMRRFDDYRVGYSRIPPNGSARTAVQHRNGGRAQDRRNVERGEREPHHRMGMQELKSALVCDKIELMRTPTFPSRSPSACARHPSRIPGSASTGPTGGQHRRSGISCVCRRPGGGYRRETNFTVSFFHPPSLPLHGDGPRSERQ